MSGDEDSNLEKAKRIMERLVKTPPKPHKDEDSGQPPTRKPKEEGKWSFIASFIASGWP